MKNKKLNFSHHIIIELNTIDLISFLVLTTIILIFSIWQYGIHFENILIEVAISVVFYTLFLLVQYFLIKRKIDDYPQISNQINMLFQHVQKKIKTTDNEDELKQDLNNLSNSIFLSLENNGLPIKFDPDNEAINKLFVVKNLIIITEAEPYKWLDPTYIFYLINNSILNLNWKNDLDGKIPLKFALDKFDHSDKDGAARYEQYELEKKQFIVDLSNVNPNNTESLDGFFNNLKGTARFMFLSDEDLKLNKSTIEYLYTIHEMFGIFLYLINIDLYKAYSGLQKKNIFEEKALKKVIDSTNYDLSANGYKVDIGFGLKNSSDFEVFQRSKQNLEATQLKEIIKIHLADYLQRLAKYMLNGTNYEDERYLFNNYFKNSNSDLKPNTKNYFIYLN